MKRLSRTAVLLVLAGSLATVAVASRKPDHDEATKITTAFKTTKKAGLNTIAHQFDVVRIRVSTVNPRFARGNFVAKPKYRNRFQAGYGVARLNKAGTKWTALDVGSAFVGCMKVVPRAVRADLKLVCH
jgi:hypothetical protein